MALLANLSYPCFWLSKLISPPFQHWLLLQGYLSLIVFWIGYNWVEYQQLRSSFHLSVIIGSTINPGGGGGGSWQKGFGCKNGDRSVEAGERKPRPVDVASFKGGYPCHFGKNDICIIRQGRICFVLAKMNLHINSGGRIFMSLFERIYPVHFAKKDIHPTNGKWI